MRTKEGKGNQEIKRIRKELGLTQSQLAFQGMAKSVIAKIESGERELNFKQAAMLATRFQEFGYKISAKVLMGQDRDIAEVLKLLENNINEEKLDEIDNIILNLGNDKAVELILAVIQTLKVDVYSYANNILKYILKLNEFKINKEIYIKINIDLIGVYSILNNFDRVLIAANAIKIYLNEFSRHDSFKYHYNLANAHYNLKQCAKAKEHLRKARKNAENKYKLDILSLESNILIMEKKFTEAILINEKIIEQAKTLHSYDYIANSNSNISYILTLEKKFNDATQYITKAMEYIDDIDDLDRLNVLDNKFYLEVSTNLITLKLFKTLMLLCRKLNDISRQDGNIKLLINKFIESNKNGDDFLEIFVFLRSNGISIKSELKLKVVQYIYKKHRTDCDFESFLDKMIDF